VYDVQGFVPSGWKQLDTRDGGKKKRRENERRENERRIEYRARQNRIGIASHFSFLSDLSGVSRPYQISVEFFCKEVAPKLTENDTVLLIHKSGDEKV
jgi:hypothetical protein